MELPYGGSFRLPWTAYTTVTQYAKLPSVYWPSPCIYTRHKLHPESHILKAQTDCPLSWLLPGTSGLPLASVSGPVGVIRCVRRLAKYDNRSIIYLLGIGILGPNAHGRLRTILYLSILLTPTFATSYCICILAIIYRECCTYCRTFIMKIVKRCPKTNV